MIDMTKLGDLVEKGYSKEYSCGCILVDSTIQPILSPCCYEHQQLLKQSRSLVTMPFGKHKGEELKNLPENYLFWLSEQELDEPLKSKVAELVERGDFA